MHRLTALVVLAPFLFGFSTFSSYFDWQAAVGAHELETFDDAPDQEIPSAGGSILLDGFAITADGNHSSGGDICSGLCAPKVEGGKFRGDVHGSPERPTYNRFEFFGSISAIAFELSEVEDNFLGVLGTGFSESVFVDDDATLFLGLVLDTPITHLTFSADFQGYSVDNVRWVSAESPVPEPSGALILALGLGIAAARRTKGREHR